MSFFKKEKNETKVEEQVKEKKIGLVIQITEIAVYVYISRKTYISTYGSEALLNMEDMDGNYIGVNGNYITLEVNESQIEQTLEKFGVKNISLPVIKIEVNER